MKTIIKFYATALVAMLLLTSSCKTEDEGTAYTPPPPCECLYTQKIIKTHIYEVGQPTETIIKEPVKTCGKDTNGRWVFEGTSGGYFDNPIYIEFFYKIECPK